MGVLRSDEVIPRCAPTDAATVPDDRCDTAPTGGALLIPFVLGRLAKAVVILLAILVFNFFLIHAAPGDPAAVMAGEAGAADEKFLEDLRIRFGLDKPLLTQLWIYISGAVQLDLGYSYRQGMPVAELLWDRLPATLLLTMSAFVISIVFGVIAGVAASARQGGWGDTIISALAMVFYATPLFWVALMASLLFSVTLGWLPGFGYETVGARYTGIDRVLDIARHLVLRSRPTSPTTSAEPARQ